MTIRIPLSAPDITDAEIDAVTAVLRTNRLSLGPELEAFERAVAAYHSIPDAVAVSSGTAGLHLALLALGIGEGCEVIVPSYAFVAVANAVLQVRSTPVFVDIDPVTLNLDPELVEEAITPRTRAILVVHTFGVPADMDRLQEIARRHNLALIEDACEAIGAEYDLRKVGSFGDLAVLGFYPNKQITTGEGGCVLVRNGELADRLRSLRNQGRALKHLGNDVKKLEKRDLAASCFEHQEIGYNYRLSELAAALGRAQLSRIDEILAMRRAAAERYQSLLETISDLELPLLSVPRRSISWFVYVVRLADNLAGRVGDSGTRDRVQNALARRGVAAGRYFAPIHQQPAWRARPSSVAAKVPITEMIAPRTLALPFFNRITPAQQEEVAAALSLAFQECKRY
jgi:perosamine synthetase